MSKERVGYDGVFEVSGMGFRYVSWENLSLRAFEGLHMHVS